MPKTNANLYIAYLIRLWSETPGVWRGMLEDPNSSERIYFKDLEELVAYLLDRVTEKEEEPSSLSGIQTTI